MFVRIKVMFLILVLCQVYSKSIGHDRVSDDSPAGRSDESRFNACIYPGDEGVSATSIAAEIIAYNNMTFVREMALITRWEIDNINDIIKSVSKRRCRNSRRSNLNDILKIRTTPSTRRLDRITNAYIEIAKQVHLIKYMGIKLAPIVEDCCLAYPSELSDRLTNRLLKKWYILQNGCGDNIDRGNCDVTFDVDIKEPIGCKRTSDVLHLLLKRTRKVLKKSISVVRTLRKRCRNI